VSEKLKLKPAPAPAPPRCSPSNGLRKEEAIPNVGDGAELLRPGERGPEETDWIRGEEDEVVVGDPNEVCRSGEVAVVGDINLRETGRSLCTFEGG